MAGQNAPTSFILKKTAVVVALWGVFAGSLPAGAQPPASGPKAESQRGALATTLIDSNIAISEWFDGMAEGLDLFLAGHQYTSKKNKTALILESSFYYNEKDYYSNATSLNVHLRLPNLEEYWQVAFTSYDETQERGVTQTYLRQNPREQNYGATFGFFRKLGEVRTSFQPRLSFSGTAKISHTLAFESVLQRGENYRANPKLEFYANADKGVGTFQAFNFNFVLSKDLGLTFVNEADYEDRINTYTVTNGVALGQWLSPTANISYNFFVTSQNRPNYQMKSMNVSVSWSQELYKNVLDYQLIPNVDFDHEDKYRGIPGVTLILSLRF